MEFSFLLSVLLGLVRAVSPVSIATVSPASGSVNGGSVIHVTGVGFTSVSMATTSCSFTDPLQGGNTSDVRVLSDTELECSVPEANFLRYDDGSEY